MKTLHFLRSFFCALAALSAGAFASDAGRVAVGSDTTPGNADYSYRITTPGSYYLGANIVGVPGKGGIEITVADVTLDLNGFTVLGLGAGGEWKIGIQIMQPHGPVRVFNGSVRNWKGLGIFARAASLRLDSLNVSDNLSNGIQIDGQSTGTLTHCVAEENSGIGFYLSNSSSMILEGCSARANGNSGFQANNASLRGCVATANQGRGFELVGATVVACTSNRNVTDGIYVTEGTVQECTANYNGRNGIHAYKASVLRCAVTHNTLNGIVADDEAFISGNQVTGHRSTGGLISSAGILVMETASRIENNNLTYNTFGIRVLGTSNIIVGNTSKKSGTNYFIAAGNRVGTIVIPPLNELINGSSGGAGSGTTDPWSNISY